MSFLDTLSVEPLPPAFKAGGFDCGEQELTEYLCDGTADQDQSTSFARTYLVRSNGELVGYFSLLADAIRLELKERPLDSRYSTAPAIKLGRMGIDRRFRGQSAGIWILDYIVGLARSLSGAVGIRYVTLDALRKETLVTWYGAYGFAKNKGHEKGLVRILKLASRDELQHVSMRFDILLQPEVVRGSARS